MSVWHGSLHKRKASSGKKRRNRKKRKSEMGSFPTETTLGNLKKKVSRVRGGNAKTRLLNAKSANISNPSTGETKKIETFRVTENPANLDYDRRGVITKGTIIETSIGTARVTSRPGQEGVVNAILISKQVV